MFVKNVLRILGGEDFGALSRERLLENATDFCGESFRKKLESVQLRQHVQIPILIQVHRLIHGSHMNKSNILLFFIIFVACGCYQDEKVSTNGSFDYIPEKLENWPDLYLEEIIRDDEDLNRMAVIAIWSYPPKTDAKTTGVFMFFQKKKFKWEIESIGFEEYDDIPTEEKEHFIHRIKVLLENEEAKTGQGS